MTHYTHPSHLHWLIICRHAPYTTSLARAALDAALAAATFEQQATLLFTDDGLWQLLRDQTSGITTNKSHSQLLAVLPLYDITDIYINGDAMQARGLSAEQLALPVNILTSPQIGDFIASFDKVLSF